jgi:NDP-sugar pyrophosphorylase family protein
MKLPVVILAGGFATRMWPMTKKIPKSLIEVAGKPFISHQLKFLKSKGIQKVVICTGYLGKMIQDVVGLGSEFGIQVSFSPDGAMPLGTGGAIKQALPMLDESFFVLYGDSFLPIDFEPIENAYVCSQKPALMTIIKNSNQWDKSNVLYSNGELLEYNKDRPNSEMSYIDYGLSILSRDLFTKYDKYRSFDLSDIYSKLSLNGQLEGYIVNKRFYEIGSYAGLKETEKFLSSQGNKP